MSPLGISKGTRRYQNHQDWLINDKQGEPVLGQWNHPVFCMVSDFYDQFIEDCKNLIDQGVRFFKWDALNTFRCTSPLHRHGGEDQTEKERADHYAFLFPQYVKKAMAELTAYEPELVIEIDLTENKRAMVGLASLSEGKLFWMNNGASWYGDHSTYRAKSMRMVPNEFVGWFPSDVLTFANYPQNQSPYFAQRYNVNTSLVAGRGFWGNLSEMNPQQRRRVNSMIKKAKKVFPYIRNTMTEIKGRVGASPEIYERVNTGQAAGQVMGFSGSAMNYHHKMTLNKPNFLGVVDNCYDLKQDSLHLYFQFLMADSSREAFIYSNQGSGISIIRSTSWLDTIELTDKHLLSYIAGAAGSQDIVWPKKLGKPNIDAPGADVARKTMKDYYQFTIKSSKESYTVKLSGSL